MATKFWDLGNTLFKAQYTTHPKKGDMQNFN